MRKRYGIGYNSGGIYSPTLNGKHTKAYTTWSGMLRRCYCHKHLKLRPSYEGCFVVEEWHDFQVFAKWYEDNYIEGFALDKDILFPNNKVYGPDTCCFVPIQINSLLVDNKKNRGQYPRGVGYEPKRNKFKAYIGINGKMKNLGRFNSIDRAYNAYVIAKEQYVKDTAIEWKNKIKPNVYKALMEWQVPSE